MLRRLSCFCKYRPNCSPFHSDCLAFSIHDLSHKNNPRNSARFSQSCPVENHCKSKSCLGNAWCWGFCTYQREHENCCISIFWAAPRQAQLQYSPLHRQLDLDQWFSISGLCYPFLWPVQGKIFPQLVWMAIQNTLKATASPLLAFQGIWSSLPISINRCVH